MKGSNYCMLLLLLDFWNYRLYIVHIVKSLPKYDDYYSIMILVALSEDFSRSFKEKQAEATNWSLDIMT